MSIDIIQGECREVLARLPAASVQTCITSPPFYALRDYKLPPSVWGGRADCQHHWGPWDEAHDEREEVAHGKTRTTERCYGEASRRFDGNHQKHTAGAFCRLCGAWLGCLGLEPTPALYIAHLVEVFAAVHRVLHPSGTVWLNLGDSFANDTKWGGNGSGPDSKNYTSGLGGYAGQKQRRVTGLKPKDLMMLPHRSAIALQEWGWYVRSTIVWSKSNPMPESVTDRPTQSHEYVFLLAKAEHYFYDADAIREASMPERTAGHNSSCVNDKIPVLRKKHMKLEPLHGNHGTMGHDGNGLRYDRVYNNPAGRNKRSVWTIATQAYEQAHFATFPEKLIAPMILAGTSEAGCCPRCLAPYRRVVERGEPRRMGGMAGVSRGHGDGPMARGGKGQWDEGHRPLVRPTLTVGWKAGCSCDAGPPPGCTVLDPFAGSGTTGLAAKRLGRSAILVEQNEEYCRLAQRRVDSVPYTLFSGASSTEGAAR